MASKIVRLICIELMALWLTAKLVAFMPLLAIPLIGASVVFAIDQVKEIKNDNTKNKKVQRKKAVKKTNKK